jgi:GAF domain-containing protein
MSELENLRQELRVKNQLLEALQEFSRRLHSTTELKPTAEMALRLTAQVIGANAALLYLFNKADPTELVCVAVHPLIAVETLPSIVQTVKFGTGLPGRVAQTGQSILVNNIEEFVKNEPELAANPDPNWPSRMVVPLIVFDSVIGVISLLSRLPDQFSTEQLHFAEIIAGQVAAAVQHARQVEIQKEQEQLKAVLALARKIAHDLNQPLTILMAELDLATQFDLPMDSETIEQLKEAVTEISELVREYQRIVRVQITEPVPGISVIDYNQNN